MNDYLLNTWLENFLRQSKIRRGVIISGNVIDLTFSEDRTLQPITDVLNDSLKKQGFQHVVFYSRVGGVSGISSSDWLSLQSFFSSTCEEVEGEEYDMADESDELETNIPNSSPQTEYTPADFFAIAQRVMLNDSAPRVAFIIDWSNYLFGQINALSETERGWLLQISQSLRSASTAMTLNEIDKPQSLMVFMGQGSTTLPPAMYIGNPQFSEVCIPLPNRECRKHLIQLNEHIFNVSKPLSEHSRALEDLTDLTEALTLRDINNLARLSRQQNEILSIEALVSLYRFGKSVSPWEQLNKEKLKTTVDTIGKRVKGQNQALLAVKKVLIRAYTGLSGLQHSSRSRAPKGALFFVGPTGVGKTELAKSLASFLFGDEDACLRFDMSEFNHEHADQRLVGAPPGYVGYEEGGQLTNAVKRRPFSLLLFDEIEKAHPRILDKFLQILEDGRLTDGKGDTVIFSDTFIVFTSNIGSSTIKNSNDNDDTAKAFQGAVRDHFINDLKRPEILGRIGEANIIPFNFMSDESVLISIARAKLQPLKDRLKEKWLITDLIFEDESKSLLAIVKSVDLQSGGRGVLNALVICLFDPLAQFLFDGVNNSNELKNRKVLIVQFADKACFDFEVIA